MWALPIHFVTSVIWTLVSLSHLRGVSGRRLGPRGWGSFTRKLHRLNFAALRGRIWRFGHARRTNIRTVPVTVIIIGLLLVYCQVTFRVGRYFRYRFLLDAGKIRQDAGHHVTGGLWRGAWQGLFLSVSARDDRNGFDRGFVGNQYGKEVRVVSNYRSAGEIQRTA